MGLKHMHLVFVHTMSLAFSLKMIIVLFFSATTTYEALNRVSFSTFSFTREDVFDN